MVAWKELHRFMRSIKKKKKLIAKFKKFGHLKRLVL
jgi:hypothetical protein